MCSLVAYRDILGVWGPTAPLPVAGRVQPAFPELFRTGDAAADVGVLSAVIGRDVATALRAGQAPLMVGGNCVHLTGQLSGLQAAYGPAARIGMVFVDAHGDINTPATSLSNSLGGMPVAVALGLAWPEWRRRSGMQRPLAADQVIILDGRDLDPGEVATIRTLDVTMASGPGFPGGTDDFAGQFEGDSRIWMRSSMR